MNKKYTVSALILYLNYFIHGIGCSILGQQVVKEMLALQWGLKLDDIGKVTAVAAALGLGRLISLPIAGPLSDKLGRRVSAIIGAASYAIFFVGIAFSPNMMVAYIAAVLGGLANSFLDTAIYPAVGEIFYNYFSVVTAFLPGFGCRFCHVLWYFGTGLCGCNCNPGRSDHFCSFTGRIRKRQERIFDPEHQKCKLFSGKRCADPDWFYQYRYLPAVAELCADLW